MPGCTGYYPMMRDLFDFFSPNKPGFGQVVVVSFNGMEMIGFITQENAERLPEEFQNADKALVYLPMSYMVGGFTIMVSREDIRPSQMSMDEAMRFVITAGITGQNTGA